MRWASLWQESMQKERHHFVQGQHKTVGISTLHSSIRGTYTQLYPAGSESPAWWGIWRSATAVTLNNLSWSKTSAAVTSVTLKRTLWSCFHAFWSRSRWPGSRGRSPTWSALRTRPLRLARLLPLLLWGYLAETGRRVVLRHAHEIVNYTALNVSWLWILKLILRKMSKNSNRFIG